MLDRCNSDRMCLGRSKVTPAVISDLSRLGGVSLRFCIYTLEIMLGTGG